MEAQTDIQPYLERGRQALAEGQPRDAAIAYAHAAQLEPDNPQVHLGLAEANLGLGDYRVVFMACQRVQELQPNGGAESTLAQILLNVLDHRYDRALADLDRYISQDPGNAYTHALRSYLLRAQGQHYDAGLARSRAARLSYGGRFDGSFPPLEEQPVVTRSVPPIPGADASESAVKPSEAVPSWSRPTQVQRQMVRTRFFMSQNPRFVTNIIIALNVLTYLLVALQSKSFTPDINVLVSDGAQVGVFVQQGEVWRIFTAMFLHFDILHIGLNMLSLFFIGTVVEVFYGKWRYLVIYLVSGIVGGIVTYFTIPGNAVAAGASGAIFGVFGALGAFYLLNRRSLGAYGQGAIFNWLFWLGLNLVWGFSTPGIGIQDHLGGLVAGLLLGILLSQRLQPSRRP